MIDLKDKSFEIESILESFIPARDKKNKNITEAMVYSLKAGGKRLRPMLMREAHLLFKREGEESKALYPFMAAIEMIHNYSLIHDDLPAMDNDDLRHGKPSNHVVYGEAMAILAGDGLLNCAFELLCKTMMENPDKRTAKAAYMLAKSAGYRGMIGGQAHEISFEKQNIRPEPEDIDYIYLNKTARLIMAALAIGGILGGATDDEEKKLLRAGECIGYAFQIEDDILDIVGDEKLLGKPVGSDEANEKYTFVSAYGMEKSKAKIKEYTNEAISTLVTLPGDKSVLEAIFLSLIGRNH